MVEISRNAPCPCGSGKKYKQCHQGKPLPGTGNRRAVLVLAGVAVFAGGVAVALKGWVFGLSVAGVGLVVAGLVAVLYNPPPPSGRTGGDGINFGR